MNRDDILRMSREAELPLEWISESGVLTWSELERFAALVAAHEREACAKECETLLPSQRIYDRRFYDAVGECVASIRARGDNDAP